MNRIRRSIQDIWKSAIDDGDNLARVAGMAVLLSLLSFLIVQNSIVIDIRLAYPFSDLQSRRMRLGTALLIAALLGLGIGWLAGSWRSQRLRRRQQLAALTCPEEVENRQIVGDNSVDFEDRQFIDSRQVFHSPGKNEE